MTDGILGASCAVVAQLGLALVLGASAIGKLYYKGSVDTALQKLGIRSELLRKVIGNALAPVELLLALALLAATLPLWTAYAVLGMVAVFNVVLWRLQALGYDGGCGCFGGKSAGPVRIVHLVRNAVMLVAALYLVWQICWQSWTPVALWQLATAELWSAGLMLAGLLLLYWIAGTAERLLFRAYWR